MWTRDSWIWLLVMFGAVAGYLVTLPPPTEWSYTQWLNAAISLSGLVAGYLRSSPLKGKPKDDVVTLPKLPSWIIAAVLVPVIAGMALAGCGPTAKPTLVKVDTGIYQSVKALHDTAEVLGRSQTITPAQELKIQEAILPVTVLGEQATRVLVAWKSGPTPPELQRLVAEMGALTRKIIEILPGESKGKAALLEAVAFAQQAIATALIITGGGTT